jgi:hypothetical protein
VTCDVRLVERAATQPAVSSPDKNGSLKTPQRRRKGAEAASAREATAYPMHIPPMMPRKTLEPNVALSAGGADSAVYMALATSSPPTLKPCAQARRWIRV